MTNLDVFVNKIINKLYILIIYLLATQSISLSICLFITRSVCMSVMLSVCLFVSDCMFVS